MTEEQQKRIDETRAQWARCEIDTFDARDIIRSITNEAKKAS